MPGYTGDDDDVRLVDWNRRVMPWVLAAALLPFVGFGEGISPSGLVIIAIDIGSWLVFLVDLIVRRRLVPRYLHSAWGRVDLVIVAATFPWFLFIPGAGRIVVLFRLARLARLIILAASLPTARRLAGRLGRLALASAIVMLACSYVALRADGPSDNFDNFGDALWWGIVTMTTTGYGDIVPDTTTGRITAGVLMVSGLMLLGALSASVASFLTTGDRAREEAAGGAVGTPEDRAREHGTEGQQIPEHQTPAPTDVGQEIAALRDEVRQLREALQPSAAAE